MRCFVHFSMDVKTEAPLLFHWVALMKLHLKSVVVSLHKNDEIYSTLKILRQMLIFQCKKNSKLSPKPTHHSWSLDFARFCKKCNN